MPAAQPLGMSRQASTGSARKRSLSECKMNQLRWTVPASKRELLISTFHLIITKHN